ncbi:hypothetical protein RhiLY_07275 [Ceratobasidium sp. AG-Ba]|nr:hypothetical protein RhiLY_07275 [Ceratobasidium sp. AG-Ba]
MAPFHQRSIYMYLNGHKECARGGNDDLQGALGPRPAPGIIQRDETCLPGDLERHPVLAELGSNLLYAGARVVKKHRRPHWARLNTFKDVIGLPKAMFVRVEIAYEVIALDKDASVLQSSRD